MESVMITDEEGNKMWRNAAGQLHRIDGPAIEWADGDKAWCVNGSYHREDGPAKENVNGDKWWYLHGKFHRDDGPAVECANGYKVWYLNNKEYSERSYYGEIKKKIKKKIGLETAKMFGFDKKYSWKRLWKRMETRALSDYLEEQGYIKTANQIRNLIKFASC